MFRFFTALLAALLTLVYLWCAAGTAHAGECTRQPLLNGRAGETVLVCEGTLPSMPVRGTVRGARMGRTSVVHYGTRVATR